MNEELNKLRVENLMLLAKVNERQATRMIQNRAEIVRLLQSIGAIVPKVENTASPNFPVSKPVPAAVVNPATMAAAMTQGW